MVIENKIYKVRKVVLGAALLCMPLRANLDTTTGVDLNKALTLSTSYTFTDFELARGNVRFKDGFTIPNDTTATIDVQTPVSGVISVRGTLNLAGDLHLAPGATFADAFADLGNPGNGAVHCNGHTIYLQGDLDLSNIYSMALSGRPYAIIDGQGHDIIVPLNGDLLLTDLDHTGPDGPEMTFRNVRTDPRAYFYSPGIFNLDNVTFDIHAIGAIAPTIFHFYGNFNMISNFGTYLQFAGPLTFHSGSNVYIAPGIQFGCGDTSFDTDPTFEDKSAVFHLNNSTFSWFNARQTMFLLNGTVIIEGNVIFKRAGFFGEDIGEVNIGNGNAADDLDLYILAGATLEVFGFDNGHVTSLVYGNSV